MKLFICLIALSVYSVSATPTPQFFGNFQPLTPFGNWLQNSFQNIPRPPFWNPFRPQTQVQVAPPTSSLQQVAPVQQVIPTQTNSQWPQTAAVPDRQINNNEFGYWQNWIPLPIIPQFGQEQSPTIIIISRPAKQPTTESSISNTATATANSSANQSMNISVVVPNSNEPSTNSPVPVSNSNEPSQNITSTAATPLSVSSAAQSSAAAQSSSNLGLTSAVSTEPPTQWNTSTVPPGNATNESGLGLNILNPVVVPLAPLDSTTTNASVPETTAQ